MAETFGWQAQLYWIYQAATWCNYPYQQESSLAIFFSIFFYLVWYWRVLSLERGESGSCLYLSLCLLPEGDHRKVPRSICTSSVVFARGFHNLWLMVHAEVIPHPSLEVIWHWSLECLCELCSRSLSKQLV